MSRPARLVALSALIALVGSASPLGPASAATQCAGKKPTIVGTGQADELIGTRNADVILAKGGDDTIKGKGAKDFICTGGGDDTVSAGGGDDSVYGQAGLDRLSGDTGKDMLSGGGEIDVCLTGENLVACELVPDSIEVTTESPSPVGEGSEVSAAVVDEIGQAVPGVPVRFTFTTEDTELNKAKASDVTDDGGMAQATVGAELPGTAVIKACFTGSNANVCDTSPLDYEDPRLGGLALSLTCWNGWVGSTRSLTVHLSDQFGDPYPVTEQTTVNLQSNSANTMVPASVPVETGQFSATFDATGVEAGGAEITASAGLLNSTPQDIYWATPGTAVDQLPNAALVGSQDPGEPGTGTNHTVAFALRGGDNSQEPLCAPPGGTTVNLSYQFMEVGPASVNIAADTSAASFETSSNEGGSVTIIGTAGTLSDSVTTTWHT